MISKYLAIAFLATASMLGVASAQTATNQADSTTGATVRKEGEWRASKLAGIDVYNDANEKIGDINEVILDRSGKVANVILGVGGILGLGETVEDRLKLLHELASLMLAGDAMRWFDVIASPILPPKAAALVPVFVFLLIVWLPVGYLYRRNWIVRI